MFRVLFATDGSADAAVARELLRSLPLPEGTEIEVLCVVSEPVPLVTTHVDGGWVNQESFYQIVQLERDRAQKLVETEAAELARPGVVTRTALRDGAVHRQILAAADDFNADLIVLGSRGLTGLDRLLLGSTARHIATHGTHPALIARPPRAGLQKVVLATDGSEHAQLATTFTARFPLPAAAEITIATVVKPYDPFPGLFPTDREEFEAAVEEVRTRQRADAASLVGRAQQDLSAAGRTAHTVVREGDAALEILDLADDLQADLIIAGARGGSLIMDVLLGSVADRLVKEAHCSVLLVR